MRIWHIMALIVVGALVLAIALRAPLFALMLVLDAIAVGCTFALICAERWVRAFWLWTIRDGKRPRHAWDWLKWGFGNTAIVAYQFLIAIIAAVASFLVFATFLVALAGLWYR